MKCNQVMVVVSEDLCENRRLCEELQLKSIDKAIVALVNERQRLQED